MVQALGGQVFAEHPKFRLIDVDAAVISDYPLEPHLRVLYAETVLRVCDGLPKMADIAAQMGGPARTLVE